jgi:hypothetical protein
MFNTLKMLAKGSLVICTFRVGCTYSADCNYPGSGSGIQIEILGWIQIPIQIQIKRMRIRNTPCIAIWLHVYLPARMFVCMQCCGSASKICGCGSRKKSQCGCGSGCGSGCGFMPLLNYGDPSIGIKNF